MYTLSHEKSISLPNYPVPSGRLCQQESVWGIEQNIHNGCISSVMRVIYMYLNATMYIIQGQKLEMRL